jgi:predicted alpha/beta-fold hydrolase
MKAERTKDGFVPRDSLRNGHVMTIYGWGNPRYFPRLPRPTTRYFDVADDTQVLAHCHWQPRPWECPSLLVLHGLNASSDAHYMKGIASKAFSRGMNVLRLNQRNCGNTEHLSPGLFHSGLTADVKYVVEELVAVDGLKAIAVAGPRSAQSPQSLRSSRSASACTRWSGGRTSCISGISSRISNAGCGARIVCTRGGSI